MNFMAIIIEIPGGTTGLVAGAAVLTVFAAFAYIMFRLLKKTIRMSIRMAVVAAILCIAVVGSVSIWWFASGDSARPRSNKSRNR